MDIHLKGQLPFFVADFANILECRLMGCIVDKDIYATEFADSVPDDGAAMLGTTADGVPALDPTIEITPYTPVEFA